MLGYNIYIYKLRTCWNSSHIFFCYDDSNSCGCDCCGGFDYDGGGGFDGVCVCVYRDGNGYDGVDVFVDDYGSASCYKLCLYYNSLSCLSYLRLCTFDYGYISLEVWCGTRLVHYQSSCALRYIEDVEHCFITMCKDIENV